MSGEATSLALGAPSFRASRLAGLAPFLVALIWGVNLPVMKGALEGLDPFAFNALRLSLSAAVLAVLASREPRAPAPPWGRAVGVSLLMGLLYQVLFLTGVARTSAGHTALVIASGPLWTALIGQLARVERHGARTWLALAVAFVGTVVVIFAGARVGGATLAGNALVLASALTWAGGSVLSRPLLERISPTRLAAFSSLLCLPGHWWLARERLAGVAELGPRGWAAVAYSGALSTGLALALWNVAVRHVGPARAAVTTNLVPVIALLAAWVGLGEVPGTAQIVGGGLVLAGVALSRRRG